MPAPYVGHCLCGAVRYRVTTEPLAFYACHCTDCQRRTGSAFALSMIVRPEDVELLSGDLGSYEAVLTDGRRKAGRMCMACGTRLWGDSKKSGLLVVQAGTLVQPSGLEPVAHIWMCEAQPWFVPKANTTLYERQPEEPGELARLWREAHTRVGSPSGV